MLSEKQQDKGRDERRISRKIKKGRNRLEWKGGCEERERKIAKSKRGWEGGRGTEVSRLALDIKMCCTNLTTFSRAC